MPQPPQRLAFGGGHAVLDPVTGAPLQFTDAADPARRFLLDTATSAWHSIEHQWGSGHLVTDRGGFRWQAPAELHVIEGGVEAVHPLGADVRVTVRRWSDGDVLRERYTVRNDGAEALRVTGLGVQTPFGDLYGTAEDALAHAVHAHLFTGGTWAWALAQPMSGTGRGLGLIVREGAVRAYSIESRNPASYSNVRGHIALLTTDRARNPDAFGGQPELAVAPGGSLALEWELGWYDTVADFLAATRAPARFSAFAAETGQAITVEADAVASPDAAVAPAGEGRWSVTADRHGVYTVDIGGARTEVLFHDPLETVVRRRVDYIARHQVARERPGLLAHAFVPVDVRTRTTHATNGWQDWTDGSERLAMPLLVQLAALRGWTDPDAVEPLLAGWAEFAWRHLLDADATPTRGSQVGRVPRLYDAPWLAQFFHDRHRLTGSATALDRAARIIERNFALGGAAHLSITLSETTVAVAAALDAAGLPDRAARLRDHVIASARHFVGLGRALPAHEVNYEQSIVAPLIDLLTAAYELTGEPVFRDAVAERLPWLLAFSGPQPHARLHGVAIRHWDGYWFGIERLWGDVFPHHWSALTAATLQRLPAELRTPETDRLAEAVHRANMANQFADGSATCAFVMPSTVDGRAAHRDDPLANDQDWHLVLWMRALGD
ncbi:hypothetical protein [Glycomyces terrestris]|uniref:Uncharacterized protein n=1 Tax=Glycomyces terrestris TaxID=2493553 RepID=A0A426UV53_9ACTN|nr:hypothetical protein [Glycomyces terrestris]RRR98202.1 hypothetical protein EIW28_14890 [Glycomyces terrestris]